MGRVHIDANKPGLWVAGRKDQQANRFATPEIKILGSLLDPSAQGPRRESRLLCHLGMPPNPQPFGPISH